MLRTKDLVPRLLIVTTVSKTIRAFLLDFASYFRSNGWRVDAMARGVSQCSVCNAAFDGTYDVGWSRNPLNPMELLTAIRRVRQIVLNGRYDIVHVHTPVASFVTRLALRSLDGHKPKIVYTAHGFHFHPAGNPVTNWIYAAIERMAARWTDRIVVINETDGRAASELGISPKERLHNVPGFWIDRKRFNPSSISALRIEEVRRRLKLTPSDYLLVMVAELSKRKRPGDALRAFAALKQPDTYLALAGDGPLLGELRQMAEDLGIGRRVLFLGHFEDIPALMKSSLATVLTSSQEGLPACVIESLSLGVPVIGTEIRGTSDLLRGGGGILAPLADVGALSAAMRRMLTQPEEVSAMGAVAGERFRELDWLTTATEYERIYLETLRA
jgi:glycosyltransferase involved in cell wall biosynthesis